MGQCALIGFARRQSRSKAASTPVKHRPCSAVFRWYLAMLNRSGTVLVWSFSRRGRYSPSRFRLDTHQAIGESLFELYERPRQGQRRCTDWLRRRHHQTMTTMMMARVTAPTTGTHGLSVMNWMKDPNMSAGEAEGHLCEGKEDGGTPAWIFSVRWVTQVFAPTS